MTRGSQLARELGIPVDGDAEVMGASAEPTMNPLLEAIKTEIELLGVLADENDKALEKEQSPRAREWYAGRASAFYKARERLQNIVAALPVEV